MTKSVALCTYNGEKFLKEQLDSILSQKIAVDEIVICDDASTDGTISILKDYESKFPGLFHIFINSENLGYVQNFEKALSLCKGDVIFLCDQDDVWNQDKVGIIGQYFTDNPEIGLVAHDVELTDSSSGNQTFWEMKKFETREKELSSDELLEYILVTGNVFPGMSLAIRKKILADYLPLKKVDSIIIHDYEMIIKALRDEKFEIINNVLGTYRQHDAQSIGYKDRKKNPVNEITAIHLQSQHYLRIKNYIEVFKLNQNIGTHFRAEIKNKYSVFLKSLPLIQRVFTHLKIKYYYKIIRF